MFRMIKKYFALWLIITGKMISFSLLRADIVNILFFTLTRKPSLCSISQRSDQSKYHGITGVPQKCLFFKISSLIYAFSSIIWYTELCLIDELMYRQHGTIRKRGM